MTLYRWATTDEEIDSLLREGWAVVAEHPCFIGRSVLMRRDREQ